MGARPPGWLHSAKPASYVKAPQCWLPRVLGFERRASNAAGSCTSAAHLSVYTMREAVGVTSGRPLLDSGSLYASKEQPPSATATFQSNSGLGSLSSTLASHVLSTTLLEAATNLLALAAPRRDQQGGSVPGFRALRGHQRVRRTAIASCHAHHVDFRACGGLRRDGRCALPTLLLAMIPGICSALSATLSLYAPPRQPTHRAFRQRQHPALQGGGKTRPSHQSLLNRRET
jgi:hypothetical protein